MDSSGNIIFIQTDLYIKDMERNSLAYRLMLSGNQSEHSNHGYRAFPIVGKSLSYRFDLKALFRSQTLYTCNACDRGWLSEATWSGF